MISAVAGTRTYYVYTLANKSGTLCTGVTGMIRGRVWQHKTKQVEGFTKKYNIDRLVFYEAFTDVRSAIAREKQIKGWVRRKKLELIVSLNPEWHDLSDGSYG